jgi:hypothetical protein
MPVVTIRLLIQPYPAGCEMRQMWLDTWRWVGERLGDAWVKYRVWPLPP